MDVKDFLEFGPFRADARRKGLTRNGESVPLPAKAFDVLYALLQKPGQTVSKDDLMQEVWPDTFVEEGNLTQTVFLLRKTLGETDGGQPFIITVPRQGYRFVGDVRGVANRSAAKSESVLVRNPGIIRWPWIAGVLGIVALGAWWQAWQASKPRIESQAPLRRFVLGTPVATGNNKRSTAISPDGKQIALVHGEGSERLWIQHLDQEQAKTVEGSEGATNPFWSPDSKVVGFGAQFDSRPALMRVPAEGGVRTRICEIPAGFFSGGTWSPDGNTIVFASGGPGALYEVPATGGVPKPIGTQDAIKLFPAASKLGSKDLYLRSPHFLPMHTGRRAIVFEFGWAEANLLMSDLDTGRTELLGPGRLPAYSPTGHLVFQSTTSSRDLWAQPFSLDTLKTTGPAFTIVRNGWEPSVSREGTLVYVDPPSERLVWVNRQGQRLSEAGPLLFGVFFPTISPDGRRVAAEARESENLDVWVYDLARGSRTRLSFDPATELLPVWSPDGEQVAYSSWRSGNTDIFVRRADGDAEEKTLVATPAHERVSDWSRDGKHILYSREDPKTSWDLWYLKRNGAGGWEAGAFLQKRSRERAPKFSPDGRYVAYLSDESGRDELYVRPFPQGERQWVVSRNGAAQPRWARNGRQLFYVEEGTLMEIPVRTTPEFSAGAPVPLFAHSHFARWLEPNYDVSADGERFLVPGRSEQGKERSIHVVQNWFTEFRDRH